MRTLLLRRYRRKAKNSVNVICNFEDDYSFVVYKKGDVFAKFDGDDWAIPKAAGFFSCDKASLKETYNEAIRAYIEYLIRVELSHRRKIHGVEITKLLKSGRYVV